MNRRKICLVILLVAFWPVWLWYFQRTIDQSDEPLGLVALITILALVLLKQRYSKPIESLYSPIACTVLLFIYCLCWPWTPKIAHAFIAVFATGIYLTIVTRTVKLTVGDWVLLGLSLPIVASLNFYIGFPLRLLVCSLATPLITMSGFPSIAQGTAILWNDYGHEVYIDAPCSGIKMLWTSMYFSATLASLFELKLMRSILLLCASMGAALIANVIRVTALFYIETGILPVSAPFHDFVHQGIGVLSFAVLACLILLIALWFRTYRFAESERKDKVGLHEATPTTTVINKTKPKSSQSLIVFCLAGAVAALLPFMPGLSVMEQSEHKAKFPGWPSNFEGRPINAVPLPLVQQRFAADFPGKIGVFTDGASTIIMRWVQRPTRQLHPASDCYKGLGYRIKWLPQYVDRNKNHWFAFEAKRGNNRLVVREIIFDTKGNTWNDVSAWYWAAFLKQTSSPWWNVVMAEHRMLPD